MKKSIFTLLFFLTLFANNAKAAPCTQAGQIVNNGDKLEFCDGTNWKLLGAPELLPTSTGCRTNAGKQVYENTTYNRMEFCNATITPNIKYVTDCSTTANTCLATEAGEQIYNSGINMMQFCNGVRWINMGSLTNLPCCPDGFIPVPADPARAGTVKDFCVSKYHMKAVKKTTGNPDANGIVTVLNDYYPESRPDDLPWRKISFQDAQAKCSSLGADFHLITNPEWMTIAISIENYSANWSGGGVGLGHLPTGHSDGNPSHHLDANVNDALGCDGTNNSDCLTDFNAFFQRRTFFLSNGETIWDMAGNISSWVSPDLAGSPISYSLTACDDAGSGNDNPCVQEINDDFNVSAPQFKYRTILPLLFPEAVTTSFNNYLAFYPSNLSGTFYSTTGVGLDYYRGFGTISWRSTPFYASATGIAMYRGGSYNETDATHPASDPRKFVSDGTTRDRRAGIFSTWLTEDQTTDLAHVGFRCVYTPP